MSLDDDFRSLFSENDLNDLVAVSHNVMREQEDIEFTQQLLGDNTKYFSELADEMYAVGIVYQFNEEKRTMMLTMPNAGAFDIISLDMIEWHIREGVPPAALAMAIAAGMMFPRFYRFWGEDEEDD